MTGLGRMKAEETYVLAPCGGGNSTVSGPGGQRHYGHVMITEPNSMFPLVSSNTTGALPSLSLLSVPNRGTGGIFLRVVQASGPVGTGVLHHDYCTLHSPSRKANGTVFELSKGTWSGGRGTPVRVARLPV